MFLRALLLLFLLVISTTSNLGAEEKFRIGAVLPLSGPASSLGNYLKTGIELAYNKLPEEKRSKIELTFEDDKLESKQAVSAVHKLKASGVNAVFVMGSGIGNAIAPIAEREKFLLVAIGASDGSIVKNRRYAFLHWVTPEVEAKEMVLEMKRRGYQRIGIVTTEQEGAIAVLNAVRAELDKGGFTDKVVVDSTFLPDVSDFKTYIAKAKSKKVDAAIVLLFPGPLASFAKQAKAHGLSADLVGVELFEDENEVKASEGALIGHWYVNADVATGDFMQTYRDAYKQHPGWGAANAFDTLNLVADAVTLFGPDTEKVVDYLNSLTNYSGAAGVYSASGDNRFTLPAAIKMVTKDGFKKVG